MKPLTAEELKVKDVSHKIFLRLLKWHNTITPDMQLHIEDVLKEEYASQFRLSKEKIVEVLNKYDGWFVSSVKEQIASDLSAPSSDNSEIIKKQDELIAKLTEILVHVGLPGEYNPEYNLINELSEVECNQCKDFAKELSQLESELSELKSKP